MRSTPSPLPGFITSYRHRPSEEYLRKYCPYTNIYEICPNEPYVFGTESLYGDWDAELLILEQDAGPAGEFERLRDNNHERPFAHREWRPGYPRYNPKDGTGGAATNEIVYRLGEHLACAKLYGSALIGMCRPRTNYSKDKPPPDTGIRPHCVEVLRWVLDPHQTPELRAVMCLGKKARNFVDLARGSLPPRANPVQVFETPHPAAHAAIGKYEAVLPKWREMAKKVHFQFIERP